MCKPSFYNILDALTAEAKEIVQKHFKKVYQVALDNDFPESNLLDISEKFSEVVAIIFLLEKHIAFYNSSYKYKKYDDFEADGNAILINRQEAKIEESILNYVESEK